MPGDTQPDIYLASHSPRRRELLGQIALPFSPLDVSVDESWDEDESPEVFVIRVALEKARAGWAQVANANPLPTLGADTVVVQDGTVLGKPRDRDDALAMLATPTPEQANLLGACRFQANRALLHTDTRLMPESRRVWASWNYLARQQGVDEQRVSVSYYMNSLHRLERRKDYIISLNPWREPHPTTVLGEYHWRHPVLDTAAVQAQARLDDIQGLNGVYIAGAWTGFGFHEDGIRSAVDIAGSLGISPPWEERDPERGEPPTAPAEVSRAA